MFNQLFALFLIALIRFDIVTTGQSTKSQMINDFELDIAQNNCKCPGPGGKGTEKPTTTGPKYALCDQDETRQVRVTTIEKWGFTVDEESNVISALKQVYHDNWEMDEYHKMKMMKDKIGKRLPRMSWSIVPMTHNYVPTRQLNRVASFDKLLALNLTCHDYTMIILGVNACKKK